MRHALALLTLVLFAVPAAAQPATVSLDDAVRGIEAEYGRMTDLKAEISQTSFNKSLNQTIPAAAHRPAHPVVQAKRREAAQGRGLRPVGEHVDDEVQQARDHRRAGGRALRVRPAQGRGDRPAEVARSPPQPTRPPIGRAGTRGAPGPR